MAIPTSPWPISPAGGLQSRQADSVSGLKVIDPLTLQVTTTQPGATTLAKTGGPVLSKAWYGKGVSAGESRLSALTARQAAGQRPYAYDKYIPGQEIRFHANSHFTEDAATPRFIYRVTNPSTNFQLFQTGRPTTTPLPRAPTILSN